MNAELKNIFIKTVTSTNPGKLLRSWLSLNGTELKVADLTFSLHNNCYVVGFGKAVYGMAVEIENTVGRHLQKGVISIPAGYGATMNALGLKFASSRLSQNSVIKVIEGGRNNLPDENSFKATVEIKRLAEQCREDHLLFVLISGGGSALLSYPTPPLSLEEKCDLIRLLSSAGASIGELNVVRKALSQVKGGKLALSAFPSTVVAFILSDIVGDPIDLIASGPTALSTDHSRRDVFAILNKYELLDSIGDNVKKVLCAPKPEVASPEYRQFFNNKVRNIIIGNNQTILNGIKKETELLGNSGVVLSRRVDGSVDRVVKVYMEIIQLIISYQRSRNKAHFLKVLKNIVTQYDKVEMPYVGDMVDNIIENLDILDSCWTDKRPLFLICGGEPTIEVRGKGIGGRNQELALRIAVELNKLMSNDGTMEFEKVSFASFGTDGIDGPTDAAGAVVSATIVGDALEQGLNPSKFLLNNDTYTFFSLFKSGDQLLKCGHTGMNVMDVHIIVFNILSQ